MEPILILVSTGAYENKYDILITMYRAIFIIIYDIYLHAIFWIDNARKFIAI